MKCPDCLTELIDYTKGDFYCPMCDICYDINELDDRRSSESIVEDFFVGE